MKNPINTKSITSRAKSILLAAYVLASFGIATGYIGYTLGQTNAPQNVAQAAASAPKVQSR